MVNKQNDRDKCPACGSTLKNRTFGQICPTCDQEHEEFGR